jgi:hypothetical protein
MSRGVENEGGDSTGETLSDFYELADRQDGKMGDEESL